MATYFKNLSSNIFHAGKRFPEVFFWSVACCLYFLVSNKNPLAIFDLNPILSYTFMLGFSWLIGARVISESFPHSRFLRFFPLLVVGLLVIYYLVESSINAANTVFMLRWWLLFIAGHIFVVIAPFIKNNNNITFLYYLLFLVSSISRSLLYSIILYAGVSLAFLALEYLLQVKVGGIQYARLFVFCASVINTLVFLAEFPQRIKDVIELPFNKAMNLFIQYILLPLLLLYLFILYAYSLKIIILWELPKGWIAYLMVALSLIGFLIQIVIQPYRKDSNSFLFKYFYPWFYILLTPLLIFLFIAIFKRIGQYGYTENRYLLLLLSFWIVGIVLYLLIASKKEMRILPISIFVLLFFSIYSPFNAFKISLNSQKKTLVQIFYSHNQLKSTITKEEYHQFKDIVFYLKQRKQMKLITNVLGEESVPSVDDDFTGKWTQSLLNSLNIKVINSSDGQVLNPEDIDDSNLNFLYFSAEPSESYSLDGFEKMQILKFYEQKNAEYQIEYEGELLKIKKNGQKFTEIDMEKMLSPLLKQYQELQMVPPSLLIYNTTTSQGKIKVIFTSIQISIDSNGWQISNIEGMIFY